MVLHLPFQRAYLAIPGSLWHQQLLKGMADPQVIDINGAQDQMAEFMDQNGGRGVLDPVELAAVQPVHRQAEDLVGTGKVALGKKHNLAFDHTAQRRNPGHFSRIGRRIQPVATRIQGRELGRLQGSQQLVDDALEPVQQGVFDLRHAEHPGKKALRPGIQFAGSTDRLQVFLAVSQVAHGLLMRLANHQGFTRVQALDGGHAQCRDRLAPAKRKSPRCSRARAQCLATTLQGLLQIKGPAMLVVALDQRTVVTFTDMNTPAFVPGHYLKHLPVEGDKTPT